MNEQKLKYNGKYLDEKVIDDMLLFKAVFAFKKQQKITETNLAKLIKLYKGENNEQRTF